MCLAAQRPSGLYLQHVPQHAFWQCQQAWSAGSRLRRRRHLDRISVAVDARQLREAVRQAATTIENPCWREQHSRWWEHAGFL